MEQQTFETETKSLGIALFILIIGGSFFALLISFLLLSSGYSESDSMVIGNALGLIGVEVFVIQHYTKKLKVQLNTKMPKGTLSFFSFCMYTIVALGLFWGSNLVFSFLTEALSDIITFGTPDFTPDGTMVGNVFNIGYGVVLAPILEELIFRGLFLGKLKDYGTIFAIVTVSFLFALLHGNLPQSIPAFFFSIVICCLTIKSGSVLPAILVHVIANLIGYLGMVFTSEFFIIAMGIFLCAVMLVGTILAICYLRKTQIRRLKDEPHRVMEFFGSWGSITFLIISVLTMILSMEIIF